MSAKIIPFPAPEFNMNEFLFGTSPLSQQQRFALADALQELADAQGRLAAALDAAAITLETKARDGGAE